jgi:hypothetical protein
MLRANGIETLILTGIITSGVVLSTLCDAADADYRLLVAADCCSDDDEETHRVLLEKVFPRRPPSRRLQDLRRLSGLGGRRRQPVTQFWSPLLVHLIRTQLVVGGRRVRLVRGGLGPDMV